MLVIIINTILILAILGILIYHVNQNKNHKHNCKDTDKVIDNIIKNGNILDRKKSKINYKKSQQYYDQPQEQPQEYYDQPQEQPQEYYEQPQEQPQQEYYQQSQQEYYQQPQQEYYQQPQQEYYQQPQQEYYEQSKEIVQKYNKLPLNADEEGNLGDYE